MPRPTCAGHVANATLIESMQLTGSTTLLEGCEQCPIAIYCRSGRRSKQAAAILEAQNFTNIYDGLGINQWQEAGYELVDMPSKLPTPCADPARRSAVCVVSNGTALLETLEDASDDGLELLAILAIAIGGSVCLLLLLLVAFWYYRRSRHGPNKASVATAAAQKVQAQAAT